MTCPRCKGPTESGQDGYDECLNPKCRWSEYTDTVSNYGPSKPADKDKEIEQLKAEIAELHRRLDGKNKEILRLETKGRQLANDLDEVRAGVRIDD